ncbi:protein scabrous-like [Watersipora subatra]|uniref:protein scabrous-like n=1 Tax=Watersipora subatra TaxID=2589382 RepID=UPI00355C4E18
MQLHFSIVLTLFLPLHAIASLEDDDDSRIVPLRRSRSLVETSGSLSSTEEVVASGYEADDSNPFIAHLISIEADQAAAQSTSLPLTSESDLWLEEDAITAGVWDATTIDPLESMSTAHPTTPQSRQHLTSLQGIVALLNTQQDLLLELKEQLTHVNVRLDTQQSAIDTHEQDLSAQSWKLAELTRSQLQMTNDLYNINSAVNTHKHEETTSSSSVKVQETSDLDSLAKDIQLMDARVQQVERVQENLVSVVDHLVSGDPIQSIPVTQSDASNHSISFNESVTELALEMDEEQPISEVDVQKIEERTNQLVTSVDRWTEIEQVLHNSLRDMQIDHEKYEEALSFLTNYTLNNAEVLSQLAEARIEDASSIMILMNTSSWLSQQLYLFKAAVRQNKNLTDEMVYRTESNLNQLLELIQLNSMKVELLQETLTEQGSSIVSHLNYTDIQLFGLERSLNSLEVYHNSSYSEVAEKLDSNKEKSDMLWSRVRILDDRLAHVEVKYLTEELNKYQKSNDDLRQSLKLMEIDNELETIKSSISRQLTNHGNLDDKLKTVENRVDALSSSLSDLRSAWTEFYGQLPQLRLMYSEVQMMINILPADCDDVYTKGIVKSGVQLAKPNSNMTAVKLLCDIDLDAERGWTVIQQRRSGLQSFNQNWTSYRNGFGSVDSDGEFWIGNEVLHGLTSSNNYTVRFDMWTINGTYIYAVYDQFRVFSEAEGYKMEASGYSGNATDSLQHSSDMSFSTPDVDNDLSSTHCAQFYTAGWWYKHCQYCNLNGRHTVGIIWFNHESDRWMELRQTSIKISRHHSGR